MNGVTGRPAKRIRVAVAPGEARSQETATVTGEDGRFLFENMKAGKYHLTAVEPNGRRQVFQPPDLESAGFGSAIVTGPGPRTDNLVFRLVVPGAILGRVLELNGERVEAALVQVFRSMVVLGSRSVRLWATRYTDDRGDYRVSGLGAGTYYVVVSGRPWYTTTLQRSASSEPLDRMSYGTVFYPNTRDARAASPLDLKPGQELQADFSLAAAPAGKLRVTVQGAGQSTTRINVVFEGVGGSRCFERVVDVAGEAPTFISGIMQGKYTLEAAATGAKPLYGLQTVNVGAAETEVQVAMREAPVVQGVVKLEDGPANIPQGTLLELGNEGLNRHIRRPVSADGQFRFEALPPGTYQPLLMGPAKLLHLRGVKVDGKAVADEKVEADGPVQLELTALLKGGSVVGNVYRKGASVAGVLAVLVPENESPIRYDYRGFQTDSDGSFEFTGLVAGDYVLFVAPESAGEFEYANPAVVRPYLATGRPVHVEKGREEKIRVDIE
jgi:hypothetical protein